MVHSTKTRELLINSGFKDIEIVLAGNIRYNEKVVKLKELQKNSKEKKIILLPLTAGIMDSLELIYKINAAFKDNNTIQIILKPHPVLPLSKLQKNLPPFPSHITFEIKKIEDLLDIADLVIYTETAVSIQALAQGIPVLHIQSDVRIDMNPLEGYECIPSVSTPEEMYSAAKRLMKEKDGKQEQYMRIASEFFEEGERDLVEIFCGQVSNLE